MHWCVATESWASKFLDLLVFYVKWPNSQATPTCMHCQSLTVLLFFYYSWSGTLINIKKLGTYCQTIE